MKEALSGGSTTATSTIHPIAQKVIAEAKRIVDSGYQEGPNNDTIFGKWFGLNFNPWCAMFVSWCFKEAGASHLIASQSSKGFASCTYGMKHFANKGQLVPIAQAQPGDIVFFNFDNDTSDAEHVGIVIANDKKKKVLKTAEGNTSAPANKKGSQSNGDGAYFKDRPYTYCFVVARPNWDAPAPKKSQPKKPATKKATPAKKAPVKKSSGGIKAETAIL